MAYIYSPLGKGKRDRGETSQLGCKQNLSISPKADEWNNLWNSE